MGNTRCDGTPPPPALSRTCVPAEPPPVGLRLRGSRLVALAVLVMACCVPAVQPCPRSCNCYQANEVHCTFRSLLSVPQGLPAHTQRINLG